MPKVVDHSKRRMQIGEAALEVIVTEGLERLTVRKIAAASGWSTGVLAHYARNKDDMIALAVEAMTARFIARLEAIETDDTRDTLRAVLRELLPLDAERRTEALAWFRLAAYDPDGSGTPPAIRLGHRELRRLVAELVATVDPQRDAATAAKELLALADGLAVHHLIDPRGMPRTKIEAVLDARLDEV